MWDHYYYYASTILVISTGSICVSLYEILTNNAKIREMAHYSCPIKLMISKKDNLHQTVNSKELVPGDVIVVP